MEALRGKTVLLVGRDYFFYTREIAAELRRSFGATVHFVPIEPAALWYRLLKKAGVLAAAWLRRYHRAALARLRGQPVDVVLFIQVHQIGAQVREYRAAFPAARFVLYYWDSLRTHDYLPYLQYFERCCSFDPQDAERVPGVSYLPLFFAERFRALRAVAPDRDIAFVGAAVSLTRYEELQRFRSWAEGAGVSLLDYLVVSPFLYLRMLLRGRLLRGVHFRGLGVEPLLRLYGRAHAILDLPNNLQSGYTMRTFEALGAHRKLITTNERIVRESFYTPEAICVLGQARQFPPLAFVRGAPAGDAAIERYSLRCWLAELLGPLAAGGAGRSAGVRGAP
jgi:hypothetical protein